MNAPVSLWEIMFKYSVGDLHQMVTALLRTSTLLRFAKDPDKPILDENYVSSIIVTLNSLHTLGKAIELDSSLLEEISRLRDDLWRENNVLSALVVKTRLETILHG